MDLEGVVGLILEGSGLGQVKEPEVDECSEDRVVSWGVVIGRYIQYSESTP